jgi:membrane dipeptidase
MTSGHHERDWTEPTHAAKLHREAIIVDGQGVALLLPAVLIPPPPLDGQTFLERAAASGVSAMNTTLGLGGIATGRDDLRALLSSIYGYLCYFELEADRVLHVLTADDIERAKREKKLGVIFGVQGLASKIDDDLTLLRILHRLGLRVAQLTHNERNALGCGCLETPDTGLTQLGRACVAELNHVGILVDLAHAGARTAREAIETSTRPCTISHANAFGLRDNPRNVPDEVLRALAARGGVLGVTAYAPFCETAPGVRPKLDDLVSHIEYVADLVGIDHVGIGSDFFETESEIRFARFARSYPAATGVYASPDTVYVDGFERIDRFPRLTEALVRRRFSDENVLKVLGRNFLRVFRHAWS